MNDKSYFGHLAGRDLEQVAGGMSCSDAVIVAKVDSALSDWYGSLGMTQQGSLYTGHGLGVLQGACDVTPK